MKVTRHITILALTIQIYMQVAIFFSLSFSFLFYIFKDHPSLIFLIVALKLTSDPIRKKRVVFFYSLSFFDLLSHFYELDFIFLLYLRRLFPSFCSIVSPIKCLEMKKHSNIRSTLSIHNTQTNRYISVSCCHPLNHVTTVIPFYVIFLPQMWICKNN